MIFELSKVIVQIDLLLLDKCLCFFLWILDILIKNGQFLMNFLDLIIEVVFESIELGLSDEILDEVLKFGDFIVEMVFEIDILILFFGCFMVWIGLFDWFDWFDLCMGCNLIEGRVEELYFELFDGFL